MFNALYLPVCGHRTEGDRISAIVFCKNFTLYAYIFNLFLPCSGVLMTTKISHILQKKIDLKPFDF